MAKSNWKKAKQSLDKGLDEMCEEICIASKKCSECPFGFDGNYACLIDTYFTVLYDIEKICENWKEKNKNVHN